MGDLAAALDQLAEDEGFWGVARADVDGVTEIDAAYGLADLRHGIAATVDTRYAVASGNKGMTALVVMQLVAAGRLALTTPAREVLGADLPLIADDVTVEHLLTHTSGIGDYLDEDGEEHDLADYLMPIGVQHLSTIEAFVPVLDGFPTKFPAGSQFSYCNGAFVVLALIAERVSGVSYHDLVEQRVLAAAGMAKSGFLRSDALPGDAALGYLEVDGVLRTNVFHLPVRGTGDGGMYTTTADMDAFWRALYAGSIVPLDVVEAMTTPHVTEPDEPFRRYGLGLWLHPTSDGLYLEGCDTGVSFRSVHDPARDITHTVISNTTDGAWAISRLLGRHYATSF